jgi:hypothetical protein
MGFMDRNEPLVISHKFGYLPLRDPQTEPVELFEVMPSFRRSKAGEEFLQKYLAIVRTRLPRSLVEGWFNALSTEVDSYLHLADAGSDSDEFLGFMVQGFAIAACEDNYFGITKPSLMSECAWEAMKSLTVAQDMEGAAFRGQSCLNALLAGYLRARVHRKNLSN